MPACAAAAAAAAAASQRAADSCLCACAPDTPACSRCRCSPGRYQHDSFCRWPVPADDVWQVMLRLSSQTLHLVTCRLAEMQKEQEQAKHSSRDSSRGAVLRLGRPCAHAARLRGADQRGRLIQCSRRGCNACVRTGAQDYSSLALGQHSRARCTRVPSVCAAQIVCISHACSSSLASLSSHHMQAPHERLPTVSLLQHHAGNNHTA